MPSPSRHIPAASAVTLPAKALMRVKKSAAWLLQPNTGRPSARMKPISKTVPTSALGPRNGVRLAITASQARIWASLHKAINLASGSMRQAGGMSEGVSSGDTPMRPWRAQIALSAAARAGASGRKTSGPAR